MGIILCLLISRRRNEDDPLTQAYGVLRWLLYIDALDPTLANECLRDWCVEQCIDQHGKHPGPNTSVKKAANISKKEFEEGVGLLRNREVYKHYLKIRSEVEGIQGRLFYSKDPRAGFINALRSRLDETCKTLQKAKYGENLNQEYLTASARPLTKSWLYSK